MSSLSVSFSPLREVSVSSTGTDPRSLTPVDSIGRVDQFHIEADLFGVVSLRPFTGYEQPLEFKSLSASELIEKVKRFETVQEFEYLVDSENPNSKILTENACRRILSLINREGLKTTPVKKFWSEDLVNVPYYTPKSTEEALALVESGEDYLIDDSVESLKASCLQILEVELRQALIRETFKYEVNQVALKSLM